MRGFHIMRHAVEIHIIAQHFIKIGHRKQHLPIGHAGAVRRRRTHAVNAFRILRVLIKMIHAPAVLLAKRNLALVLQLGGDVGRQRGKRLIGAKPRQRFGVRPGSKMRSGGGRQIFQISVRILHGNQAV